MVKRNRLVSVIFSHGKVKFGLNLDTQLSQSCKLGAELLGL